MDATARAAGVSKGGLLYHFASKDALEAGLIARLGSLVTEDIADMAAATEGPVAYFLRTSVMDDDPLDRAIIAVSRLAQGGSSAASAALHDMRHRWQDALRPHTKDAAALDLVMLVSDGLYFNNALGDEVVAGVVPRARPSIDSSRSSRMRPGPDATVSLRRCVERPGRERPPGAATAGIRPDARAAVAQASEISIWRNRSAPTALRISSRISSGTGESTVSTERARPLASGWATCSPAMLMFASPSSLP